MAREGEYGKPRRASSGVSSPLTGRGRAGTRYETGRWREERADAPTWYEIPYRAIVPKGAENVLAPGRCLDCDRDAYGACRVMVNCNQMRGGRPRSSQRPRPRPPRLRHRLPRLSSARGLDAGSKASARHFAMAPNGCSHPVRRPRLR